jgi:hypothetical protein
MGLRRLRLIGIPKGRDTYKLFILIVISQLILVQIRQMMAHFVALTKCKRATVLKRRDGDVLALACRGVSVALSARYKSGLEARREQHELILLHPHPTVPSYAATNPLTLSAFHHVI